MRQNFFFYKIKIKKLAIRASVTPTRSATRLSVMTGYTGCCSHKCEAELECGWVCCPDNLAPLDSFTVPLHSPMPAFRAVQRDCHCGLKNGANSHWSYQPIMQWGTRQSQSIFRPTNHKRVMPANRSISQISQCIRQISHNTSFCNRNVHICAHFCYKILHCGIWDCCIVGFVRWAYWRPCLLPRWQSYCQQARTV